MRPELLHARGPTSVLGHGAAGPLVVVDGARLGPASLLREIAAREVAAVRYLSAWEAATRYGSGASNGVIEVTTKR